MSDTMPGTDEMEIRRMQERWSVHDLGQEIGFGNMMHLASEIWKIELHIKGLPGGEFVVGPCSAFTVPCGCGGSKDCDWCAACGWLTPHVKEIKDKLQGAFAGMGSE